MVPGNGLDSSKGRDRIGIPGQQGQGGAESTAGPDRGDRRRIESRDPARAPESDPLRGPGEELDAAQGPPEVVARGILEIREMTAGVREIPG